MNRRNLLKLLCGCLVAPFIPINNDKNNDKKDDNNKWIYRKVDKSYIYPFENNRTFTYNNCILSVTAPLKPGDLVSYNDNGHIIKYENGCNNRLVGYCKSSNDKTADIVIYGL